MIKTKPIIKEAKIGLPGSDYNKDDADIDHSASTNLVLHLVIPPCLENPL